MRFTGFTIRNFKGIGNVRLELEPAGANVFTLIGLNESGKTTILEAINHHSAMIDEFVALYGEAGDRRSSEELSKLVPKSEQSDFSDKILIQAHFAFAPGERESIIEHVERECHCKLDPDSIPARPILTREYQFSDSDYKGTKSSWNFSARAKVGRAKAFKKVLDDSPQWVSLTKDLRATFPEIAYFPTFLFNQPEKIYLTAHEGESQSNALYRTIIENIARDLTKPLDIQRHLVDRLVNEETWANGVFSILGLTKSKQQQITAAKNEISNHLTRTVFQSWSKTFGGDIGGREILLNVDVESSAGTEPRVYATFEIKDEGGQYEIRERSLGFRWFFSFILFTLFGANKTPGRSTLFLLDEPASNLHSRAQMQLLESFARITKSGNQIIYSTHSHYMINPDWLDQAFIVSNAAIDYDMAYQNDNVEAKTDISAKRYRSFVGQNPDKVTYFQPVLDKLNVAPSRLDLVKKSVLVEGKGDYRLLEYAISVGLGITAPYSIVPTRGATGMNELIGLFLGWSVPFLICLDDDAEGKGAQKTYVEEWGLQRDRVLTLADLDKGLEGKRVEDILEPSDRALIGMHFGVEKPTKSQIGLFFSEMLARREKIELSAVALSRAASFNLAVMSVLGS